MPDGGPVSVPAYLRLLRRNRNFRLLWGAQFVSEIGDWLYMVAIFSLLLQETGSAKSLAFVFVLQVLPQTFVAPAAGVLNDRLSRRSIMIATDWCRAVVVALMMAAVHYKLVLLLYVLLFLETVFWALFEPARTAVIPNITGPGAQDTLAANALSAMTWSFTLMMGSSIGGFLAAVFGLNTVFILNSLSFVISALLIRRMRFDEPHAAGRPPLRLSDMADFTPLGEGIRYVGSDRRLLAVMLVKTGIAFIGANWVLLPLFGERIFPLDLPGFDPKAAGMLGMSLLMGCRGVGALLGPFVANVFTQSRPERLRRGILFAFLISALGYGALSFSYTLPAACLAVVLAHSGGSIAWVFSTTLLQMQTSDRFRGRIFAAEQAFNMAALAGVAYAAGVLSDTGVGARTLALWTGLMILFPAVLWSYALRLWPGGMDRHA